MNQISELEGDKGQTGKLVHPHAVTVGVGSDIECILVSICKIYCITCLCGIKHVTKAFA